MCSKKMILLAVSIVLVFSIGLALAQEKPAGYPKRTIEVVVPFGAGGGSDIFARTICMPARRIMGANLVIVNKPGAQSLVGTNYVYAQPADGHTLFMGGFNFFVTNYLTGKTSLHYTDFQPILRAQYDITMLQARYDGKYKTFDDLVADAKSRPGQVTVGNVGDALSASSVATKRLCEAVGITVKFVPFDRAGKLHASLLGGHVDLMTEEPGPSMELIEGKRVRPLIVFARERIKAFPDVPTTKEMGAEDVVQAPGRGIAVKAGTPQPIVDYLHYVFKKSMESDIYKKYEAGQFLHLRPGYLGPEDCVKFLEEETVFYTREFKKLGVYKIKE